MIFLIGVNRTFYWHETYQYTFVTSIPGNDATDIYPRQIFIHVDPCLECRCSSIICLQVWYRVNCRCN